MIHQSEFKVSYKDESRIVCTYMPGSADFFVKAGNNYKYDKQNNLSMVYENDEKYKFRLIFNRGEYVCLEPQNVMANCANSPFSREKTGFDYIKPGKVKTYYSKISICDKDMRS